MVRNLSVKISHFQNHCLQIIFLAMLFVFNQQLFAQNVGIANTSPTERLTVSGNLLVAPAYIKSVNTPDPAHTVSVFPGRTDSVLITTDSTYRILDPGGNGNYAPNIALCAIAMLDSTGSANAGITGVLEITFDNIDLGTGDSIFLVDGLSSSYLFKGGSNLNGTTPLIYTGNYLYVAFSSNADASVGAGFSATVRRLFPSDGGTQASSANYGGSSLFFNTLKASLKAGQGNSASGYGSISLGMNNSASGSFSTALGNGSHASGTNDFAIGGGSASGGNSVAIGSGSYAQAWNSQAFGLQARALSSYSMAFGWNTYSSGSGTIAMGYGSNSAGSYSIALAGATTQDNSSYSTAIGYHANAYKANSFAVGQNSTVNSISGIAIGENANTTGDYAVSLGNGAHASGSNSVAIGQNSNAQLNNAIVIGNSTAVGFSVTAIGDGCLANGTSSVAIGHNASCSNLYSVALGNNVSSSGTSSLATGFQTSANGDYSTAMGCYVSTSGFNGAFTIGDNSTTTVMNTFVDNGFRARFANGYRLFTNSAASVGAFLNAGANAWAALSDVRLKENFLPVDGESFLNSIGNMNLTTWNYIGQDPKTFRHYGPMAQDFFQAFGKDKLGVIGCDTLINQQDFLGVSLIAIKALIKRTETLNSENLRLKSQVATLQQENEQQNKAFEKRLEQLEADLKDLKK